MLERVGLHRLEPLREFHMRKPEAPRERTLSDRGHRRRKDDADEVLLVAQGMAPHPHAPVGQNGIGNALVGDVTDNLDLEHPRTSFIIHAANG